MKVFFISAGWVVLGIVMILFSLVFPSQSVGEFFFLPGVGAVVAGLLFFIFRRLSIPWYWLFFALLCAVGAQIILQKSMEDPVIFSAGLLAYPAWVVVWIPFVHFSYSYFDKQELNN